MSGDQVLRVLLLKQMNGFSYRELEFHLADSVTYRTFCRLGALEPTPTRATLAENLKRVQAETLEAIGAVVIRYAAKTGVERGRKVRVDSTVVEANVHAPTDSSRLWDGVRVLTRLLKRAPGRFGFGLYTDHRRRAKRRMLAIQHTGSPSKRRAAYRDLLKVATKTVGYAQRAIEHLAGPPQAEKLAAELAHYIQLLQQVIDQTQRRVIHGERVPASEKLVSLFEPHADIIRKDRRDTLYGHKIVLAGGASGLILDCKIETGNPPDTALALEHIVRSFDESAQDVSEDAARRTLAGKRALLVLDGAEEAAGLSAILRLCDSNGVLITEIRKGSPAAVSSSFRRTLLSMNDVIVEMAGMPTPTLEEFGKVLETIRKNKTKVIQITYWRGKASGYAGLNLEKNENGKGDK